MPPHLATVLYVGLVAGMFAWTRDRNARTSPAIWIPLAWLLLSSSRSVVQWLAVMGLVALPTDAEAYADGSPEGRFVQIALMLGAIAVLLARRRLGAVARSNPWLLMFFAYAALSATWSDFGDITVRRWFRALGDPLMVLVVLTDVDPAAAVKRLLVTAGFLLIPLSVLFIKYYPDIGRTYNRWTWSMMVTGVTTHKNSLGIICQIYGIVFFWSLLNAWRSREASSRRGELFAHGVALAMTTWLFWRAGSVTAQSCFLLACFFLFAANLEVLRRNRQLFHAVVAALILVPSAVLFLGLASSALEAMGRDPTLTGRTEIWRRVLSLSGDPLLGSGFESFWLGTRLEVLQSWYEGLNSTHNGYLEIFVTLGWIGLALLVGLLVAGYRNIVALYEQDPKAGSLAMAYFIAVVVESFTEAAFRAGGVTWVILLLVAARRPDARGSLRVEVGRGADPEGRRRRNGVPSVASGVRHRAPLPPRRPRLGARAEGRRLP